MTTHDHREHREQTQDFSQAVLTQYTHGICWVHCLVLKSFGDILHLGAPGQKKLLGNRLNFTLHKLKMVFGRHSNIQH